MQFSLNSNVTLFLSVRKGLENSLLHEIKHNKFLNNINRIHLKSDNFNKFEDKNTQILPRQDTYLSSVELNEESTDTNQKWIKIHQYDNLIKDSLIKKDNLTNKQFSLTTHTRDSCDIYVQPGGLEVKCNFDWLLKSSLLVKSAESVWLRIGNPFRCHNEEQFVTNISKLPWSIYFPYEYIETIPLRIISRNSKLWSSYKIENCLRTGIKLSFEGKISPEEKIISFQDYCISVTINRNTCYLAFQFSGRLSPRIYNFHFIDSNLIDFGSYIPPWSLSRIKNNLLDSIKISKEGYSNTNKEELLESLDSRRKSYIKFQNLLTKDYSDTSDSLVAGFLHNKELFRALNSKVETIWDPFCGNGLVVCELMSLLLSLPNFISETDLPSNFFFPKNFGYYKELLGKYFDSSSPKRLVNLVGSDTNLVKLSEAHSKILKFYSFYKSLLGDFEFKENPFVKDFSLFKSYSWFPLTIHKCSFENLAHYMRNCLVLTKIPFVDFKDRNNIETFRLYRLFGEVISSKSDWKGVFVISRGRCFEYYSGLEWKTLVRSTNSNSEIKLLKWTGKTKKFRSVDEKLDQLNKLDSI